MTTIEAIILGIVQGLTEFLPVSSSGHLVLAQKLMNVDDPGVTFELLAHVGTLLSVLIYFRKELFTLTRAVFDSKMVEERKMIGYLAIGTLPAAFFGLKYKDFFEGAYENPQLVAGLLLVTGAIMFIPRLVKARGEKSVRLPSALIMGFGQAFAILPGISRSGSTIIAGMVSGVKPAKAAEFSFLLAIPAIGGAAVLQFKKIMEMPVAEQEVIKAALGPYLWGALFAFIFGLIAVYMVLSTIRKGKFEYFGYYCFVVGILGLIYFGSVGQ
jgi:undecaprenyl-diphosphatase